jgi:hypothetical protein
MMTGPDSRGSPPVPRRRRAIADATASPDSGGGGRPLPPDVAEALLDAIGLVASGLAVPPAGTAEDKGRDQPAPGGVHGLRLSPPWTVQDPELRRLCARAVFEARCGRLWPSRRPLVLDGTRGWLESVLLAEDGTALERREALRLPWREARRHAHAAVLIDMATQEAVRCLWRGRPDLPKGLKLTAAAAVLEEIERDPASGGG